MKHTEGKWHVTGGVEIRSESGLLLATMDTHLESNQVPQEANANLIASAPELFRLLKKINDWDDYKRSLGVNSWFKDGTKNDIASAIAKAEGR